MKDARRQFISFCRRSPIDKFILIALFVIAESLELVVLPDRSSSPHPEKRLRSGASQRFKARQPTQIRISAKRRRARKTTVSTPKSEAPDQSKRDKLQRVFAAAIPTQPIAQRLLLTAGNRSRFKARPVFQRRLVLVRAPKRLRFVARRQYVGVRVRIVDNLQRNGAVRTVFDRQLDGARNADRRDRLRFSRRRQSATAPGDRRQVERQNRRDDKVERRDEPTADARALRPTVAVRRERRKKNERRDRRQRNRDQRPSRRIRPKAKSRRRRKRKRRRKRQITPIFEKVRAHFHLVSTFAPTPRLTRRGSTPSLYYKESEGESAPFLRKFSILIDFVLTRQETKKRGATKIATRFKNRAFRSKNQTFDALFAPIRERLSPIRRLYRTRPGRRPPYRRAFYGRERCWPFSDR